MKNSLKHMPALPFVPLTSNQLFSLATNAPDESYPCPRRLPLLKHWYLSQLKEPKYEDIPLVRSGEVIQL